MNNQVANKQVILKVILVLILFSCIGVALPYILFVVFAAISNNIPSSVILKYPGMSAEYSRGEIFDLNIQVNEANEFFIRIAEDPKRANEINREDLLELGFVLHRIGFIKRYNPIYSSAILNAEGKLSRLSLVHVEGARVPFSSSPDGPFLELPVSRKEFEKQFGKPLSSRYSYSNPHDPR